VTEKRKIKLPVANVDIYVSQITAEIFFRSLVNSFSSLELSSEKWGGMDDDEKGALTISVIHNSIDIIVGLGLLDVDKEQKILVGRQVLAEAKAVSSKLKVDLQSVLKSDPMLMLRNIMRSILSDGGDMMYLWAEIINMCGMNEYFSDSESFITKAVREAMTT